MNDSEFASKLNRQLYYYRNVTTSILRSRTYTLANSMRVAVRSPQLFVTKAARLAVRNPRRLAQIITGQRVIQNTNKDRKRLDAEYAEWIEEVEEKAFDRQKQVEEAKKLKQQPLVSLITPVFNPPLKAHSELIESVMAQTYGNFELLLFNFGDKPEVKKLLDGWAKKDKRIVVKHGLPNGGISKNSNFCLKYVKGEYVGLLDHDDALMPNALYECVKAVNEHGAEFIYSDKDKITEDGKRHEPFFKPDLSPEMTLGGNYLTHFNLMKTSIVRDLGGWDPETDGAQDWDLFLRILDKTDKVIHVPKILYHWRTVEGSTASSMQVKPYALGAQRRAVNKYLHKYHLPGEAVQDETGQTYVRWRCEEPILYVVHMAYGDVGNVKKLVENITRSPDYSPESKVYVFVESDTLSEKQQEEFDDISGNFKTVEYKTGEFAPAITKAVKAGQLDKVVYLSDSVKKVICAQNEAGWSSQLCGWLSIPDVGLAGGAAYALNGQVVDIGSFFDPNVKVFEKYYFSTGFRSGYSGYIQWIRNFVMVSERAYAFDAALLTGSDWNNLADNVRDDEFSKALALINYAKRGRAVYDPTIRTTDNAPFYITMPPSPVIEKYLSTKCPVLLQADPYYNPNLNANYKDPKPLGITKVEVLTPPLVRTIELP
jgi:glycosyltransferase involved in cell wall biosynthesis